MTIGDIIIFIFLQMIAPSFINVFNSISYLTWIILLIYYGVLIFLIIKLIINYK